MKRFRKLIALLSLLAFVTPNFALLSSDNKNQKPKSLTEEQKIIHVLNRLGFGPRPGDIEKVRQIGLQKYIEQQLNPEQIDDSFVEAKLKNFDVLNMSTAELFLKYPNPAAVLQFVARQNGLEKGELTGLKKKNSQNIEENSKSGAQTNEQTPETQDKMKEYQRQVAEIYRRYGLGRPNEIMQQVISARIIRAVYSERQLQEVMVDFWANHFNVYSGKGAVRWYIPSYERDVLRKYALGNFKDLLVATAQHPAMLFYLDNFQSVSPNMQNLRPRNPAPLFSNERNLRAFPNGRALLRIENRIGKIQKDDEKQIKRQTRGINENYARELLELHTLGVDGGYTQQDIIEVAKCFTGWTIAEPRGYRKSLAMLLDSDDQINLEKIRKLAGVSDGIQPGEFYFNERWHEKGEKRVLGYKINEGGINDGLKVLDILVNHPSTAKHIARKLAIRFVSDNPSEALINRVAKAFSDSKGDIKTTLRALFSDPEFFNPENYRAKIKTPFELFVSAIRALGAEIEPNRASMAILAKLGEVPYGYQAPTGYPDKAEDWVNSGALLERMNFAVALASNRIPQVKVNLKRFEASSKAEILEKVIAEILHGEISPVTRQTLLKQLEEPLNQLEYVETSDDITTTMAQRRREQIRLLPPSGNPDTFKAVSLALGTPEFQRQ
ncbi:MAG: DUF1800 domain-containing protein [Acidobacteria bacterium]|jgi:uncharacterized protein (DUF1800 family)|nr:MAG: DUF1800 domain-containing protein [Acidobacteriota bacterium]GIU82061.1 MAG: hypothetical protein KatS3mg006_1125 [Pyrinomonadaceae bacterium]